MSTESHILLAAKDILVRTHGHFLLKWSLQAWESSVRTMVCQIMSLPEEEQRRLTKYYRRKS